MLHINSTKFGEITIDNKKYGQVLIIGNAIFERDEEKLRNLFNTTHQIGDWEIERLLKDNPDIVLVGTGQSGALQVKDNFLERMQKAGVEMIAATTPEAIKIYNKKAKQDKRVNALIHTTC